jgi:hypothetical protein
VARPTIRPWSFRIKSLYIGGGGGEGWMMAVDQVPCWRNWACEAHRAQSNRLANWPEHWAPLSSPGASLARLSSTQWTVQLLSTSRCL